MSFKGDEINGTACNIFEEKTNIENENTKLANNGNEKCKQIKKHALGTYMN